MGSGAFCDPPPWRAHRGSGPGVHSPWASAQRLPRRCGAQSSPPPAGAPAGCVYIARVTLYSAALGGPSARPATPPAITTSGRCCGSCSASWIWKAFPSRRTLSTHKSRFSTAPGAGGRSAPAGRALAQCRWAIVARLVRFLTSLSGG